MSTIRYFGAGSLQANIREVSQWAVDQAKGQGWHLRLAVDRSRNVTPASVDTIFSFAAQGLSWLPLLIRTDSNLNLSRPSTQAEVDDWQGFCQWFGQVLRDARNTYGSAAVPDLVEVWNEPNMAVNWSGPLTAADYVGQALKPARAGIKVYSPNVGVVVGGLAFGDGPGTRVDAAKFIGDLYGGVNYSQYFDAVAVHPYGKTRPDGANWYSEDWPNQTLARAVNEVNRAYSAKAGSERLIITETGRPSGLAPHNEPSQLDFVQGLYDQTSAKIAGYSNWHIRDDASISLNKTTGLARPDGIRKPAGDWMMNRNQQLGVPYMSVPVA